MGHFQYIPYGANYNNAADADKDNWTFWEKNDTFELRSSRLSTIQTLDKTELSVKHRLLQNVLALIIDNLNNTDMSQSQDAINDYLRMAHQMIRDEPMKVLLKYVKYPEPMTPQIQAFSRGLTNKSEEMKIQLYNLNYFSMLTFIEYSLKSYYFYQYHNTEELPYAPKVILHIILECLETYELQYTSKLAFRIFNISLQQYPTKRNEFAANLINHVHGLLLKRKIQDLDTTRYNRVGEKEWRFEDHIHQPLIEYAKWGAFADNDTQQANENESYYILLMQIMHAYSQITPNIQQMTTMIISDCVIPDITSVEKLIQQGSIEYELLQMLKTYSQVPTYPQALAYEFTRHTLFFCSILAKEDGNHNKENFIVRRMAEIIRAHPEVEMEAFILSMTQDLAYLSQKLYRSVDGFKTNLVESLTNAFRKLYSAVHSHEEAFQEDRPETPPPPPPPRNPPDTQHAADNQRHSTDKTHYYEHGSHYYEPNDTMSPRPPEWSDDESDDHHASTFPSQPEEAPSNTEIPDFVKDINIPHAVNRFEGPDLRNGNGNIEQRPFFPIYVQSDDKERNERELLNAAKRNAQHEYYKQMTKNETKDPHTHNSVDPSIRFNPAFIKAEQDLAEIRGKLMKQYITSPTQPDDPELVSIDKGDYKGYTIEFGAYLHTPSGKITPLQKHPIKQTMIRQHLDLFNEFPNRQKMAEILMMINLHAKIKEKWDNTEKTNKLEDGSEIHITLDPHEVLQDIQGYIIHSSKRFTQSPDGKMKLESNYREWDTTARKETITSEHIIFNHRASKASFQFAINIPQFTRRELFHSAYALKRANLDLTQHDEMIFSRFIDMKARLVTAEGHKVELTWSIHKHTDDIFHLTHLAYKSHNPTYTLLNPPTNLIDLKPRSDDFVGSSVGAHYTKIKDEKIYKVDELKLMQLHAQGVRDCRNTNVRSVTADEVHKSFGFVYTYDFWTLIGTCFKIEDTSAEEYLTCYTIIHRSSDFAQLKERKRLRESSDAGRGSSDAGRSQNYTERFYDEPTPQVLRHAPVSRMHRVRPMPKGGNWIIFGIASPQGEDMYYFIQSPSNDTRQLLNKYTGVLQSKVYKEFYPQTIEASASEGKPLTEFISSLIEKERGVGSIRHNPGMFCTWMEMFPKGQRPNPDRAVESVFFTAKSYWTHLWVVFLKEHRITYQSFNTRQNSSDHRMEAFDELYKRQEETDSQEESSNWHAARGRGGYGRGGRQSSREPPNHRSQLQPNRGRGGYGRGRGGGRFSFSSQPNYDPYTPDTYTLTEESPQISSMQYEIDTLRRSLNQLALLQS